MIVSKHCIRHGIKYRTFLLSQALETCLVQIPIARISENSDRSSNSQIGNLYLDDPLDLNFEYTPKDFLTEYPQDTQDWMVNEPLIARALQHGRRLILSNKKPTKEGLEEIYTLFEQSLADLSVNNIDNVIWVLATLNLLKTNLANELQKFILKNIQVLSPSQKAIIMWGFTKAGIKNSAFWKGMVMHIDISSHMSHVDFAHTVWSLAKQRIYLNKVWDPIESEVQKIIDDIYTSINLAILIWSFARADKGSKFLWERFEHNFERMLDRMNINSLSSSIWAFTSRNTAPPKMELIEQIILEQSDLKVHELACFLYCFAKLRIGSLELKRFLLDQIYVKLVNKNQNWSMVTICTLVYSFGRIYPVDEKSWDAVEKIILSNKKEIGLLEKEHQYMLLDGAGRSRRMKGDLGSFLEELAIKLMNGNYELESAAVCWHFGVNSAGSGAFWKKIKEISSGKLSKLPPHNIAILFWALVKTDELDKTIKSQILEALLNHLDSLEGDDLLQVLWCLGRVNIDPLMKSVISKLKTKFINGINLDPKDCHQLAYTLSRVPDTDLATEKAFWVLLNQLILKSMPSFDEDAYVFLSAAITNSLINFPPKVLEAYDNSCSENIKHFRLQTVCKLGLSLLKHKEKFPKIWEQIIFIVKGKYADLTNKDFTGEFLTKLFEYKIGGPEFLKELDANITSNISNSPKKAFLKIANTFTKAKQGSYTFWNACVLRAKTLLETENLTGDELFLIAISLGNRQKGDKGIWGLLETKLEEKLDSITPIRTARIASLYSLNRKVDPKVWQLLVQRVSSNLESISIRILGLLYANALKSEAVSQKDKLLLKSLVETKILNEQGLFAENIAELNEMDSNVYLTFDHDFRARVKETMTKFLESEEGKLLNSPVRNKYKENLEAFVKFTQLSSDSAGKKAGQKVFGKRDKKAK